MAETEQLSEQLSEQWSEQLSALIGDIYDAALDRSLWVDVLRRAAEFVSAPESAQAVLAHDAVRKFADVHHEFSVDPHFTQLQPDQSPKLEPTGSALLLLGSGQALGTTDVVPDEDCPATSHYNEWAPPQGHKDCVHAILDKWAAGAAQVSPLRHEASGLVDDATHARMRLIEPHLRRAMIIGNVIELRRTEAATLVDVLDGISAAMFLVNASGHIVHANASGHAMLAQGALLRAANGKLTPIDADSEQALCEAMAGGGDAAVGGKGIAMPLRARDGDRYVAHVQPLSSGARQRVGAPCVATATVLVHKPAVETGTSQRVIGKHYKLSRTELRVLLAMVQLDSVDELAAALGIVVPTAKTHLHRLFTKTGAKRRADLVKLVAGYASPLVS
jgi:DNA-binding CsgD family transcriptional regulator